MLVRCFSLQAARRWVALDVSYGSTGGGRRDLSKHTGMELQRELLKRYKARALRMLKGQK
jgi:hypothetical protein